MVISHLPLSSFLNMSALKLHLHVLSWHDKSVVQSPSTAQVPPEMNEDINSFSYIPKKTRRQDRKN